MAQIRPMTAPAVLADRGVTQVLVAPVALEGRSKDQ